VNRRNFLAAIGGAALAGPMAAAQQSAMPIIGYLASGSPGLFASYVAAFLQGLGETGYVEGQNVSIEYRWAEDHFDRLPALAADLVDRKVAVIIASGGFFSARAAQGATSTIPIVFTGVSDPIAAGLVASFPRPGGNLTGFSPFMFELMPKRLELLSELVPKARVFTLLVNPNEPRTEGLINDVQEAARTKGLQVHILKASTESEVVAAFATIVQLHAGALLVAPDPFFFGGRDQIVTLASHHAIPAIYAWRDIPAAGGLISYGPSFRGIHRHAGIYTGRILHGEKPADLPVQQPTTFELVVNQKTAKALGLTIPPSILARVDEVIE
jgi:putative ABC transport system substrate-binding protein